MDLPDACPSARFLRWTAPTCTAALLLFQTIAFAFASENTLGAPTTPSIPAITAIVQASVKNKELFSQPKVDNRKFGAIFNNDVNNILAALDPARSASDNIADYRRALAEILVTKPGILAQNVGNPDPVIYPSAEATPRPGACRGLCPPDGHLPRSGRKI